MDFKERFRFVECRLDTLISFDEISSLDYVVISKKLMLAEDRIDLENITDMMETAVMKEQKRKDEAKRKEEEREARRRAR